MAGGVEGGGGGGVDLFTKSPQIDMSKYNQYLGDTGAEQSLVLFHGSEQYNPDQSSLIWVHIVCSIGI